MVESFDLVLRSQHIEIVKNTHMPSGAIYKTDTLGFRHRVEDAIEMVRSMFDAQTDDNIMLFDGSGKLLNEYRMEVTYGRDRIAEAGDY